MICKRPQTYMQQNVGSNWRPDQTHWLVQNWSYYVKINFPRHQHDTERTQKKEPRSVMGSTVSTLIVGLFYRSDVLYILHGLSMFLGWFCPSYIFFARHQLDTWTLALPETRKMAWFGCGCWSSMSWLNSEWAGYFSADLSSLLRRLDEPE